MTHEEIKDLIAGHALDILDEEEKIALENHLPGCPECQAELAALAGPAGELSWGIEPLPLPQGHLERFREKAKAISPSEVVTPEENSSGSLSGGNSEKLQPFLSPPLKVENEPLPFARNPLPLKPNRSFSSLARYALAASLVLFVAAGFLGFLAIDANTRLANQEANIQALSSLLASPELKLTELKPTGTTQKGSARLLSDLKTNRTLLVSQDLAPLPDDKCYEVWLVGADGKAQGVGVFYWKEQESQVIVMLSPPAPVQNFKIVAITVEPRGGSPSGPTTTPFILGNI